MYTAPVEVMLVAVIVVVVAAVREDSVMLIAVVLPAPTVPLEVNPMLWVVALTVLVVTWYLT
jgi:hypothetical protein